MSTGWILSGIAAVAITGIALPSHLKHHDKADFIVHVHEMFGGQTAGTDKSGEQRVDQHQALIKLFSDRNSTPEQKSKALQALKANAAAHMTKMLTSVGVDASQRKKIEGLFDQGFAQVGKTLADKSLTDAQKNSKLEALHRSMFARLHTILNPAQIEKLHELMQNQHGGTTP